MVYSVSIGIKLTMDKRASSALFTHRYEIRNYSSTARTAARLRPGRRPGSRDARLLGQRLRGSCALPPHSGDADQSAKSLRCRWQQGAALPQTSQSVDERTADPFSQ